MTFTVNCSASSYISKKGKEFTASASASFTGKNKIDSEIQCYKLALSKAEEVVKQLVLEQDAKDVFDIVVNTNDLKGLDNLKNKTNGVNVNINNVLIVCDQLIAFHNLPKYITDILPGYNAFKKIGVEFTNIHVNRQDCSPSRASFLTSTIDTGIQDDIQESYQYQYVGQVSTDLDTIGKTLKTNGIETTGWYGKTHILSNLYNADFFVPMFNSNTRGCMRSYGFDTYNTYGDVYYKQMGLFFDQMSFDFKVNNLNEDVDYIDAEGSKYVGTIPFLKARKMDGKSFHLECHINNPHDTQEMWQNLAVTNPSGYQLQFWVPFIDEQLEEYGLQNPYDYDANFKNAYVPGKNLNTNFFEKSYEKYKKSKKTLPFKSSYELNYCTNPKVNSIFPAHVGAYDLMNDQFTMPTNEKDIKSWKNLINNYYGLVIEADNYIFKVYEYLMNNKMLSTCTVVIISDHGDMMSSHGLKQKGFHYKECMNIPFIVYSPYLSRDIVGKTSSVLGSLLDLNPTIETIVNIENPSKEFLGESLLVWEEDKLVVRKNNNAVFSLVNSWMHYYLTYPFYCSWYNKQPVEIQNKVTGKPKTYFDIFSHYTSIIDYVGDKLYKYVRYFSITELYAYNFIFNSKLKNNLTSTLIYDKIPLSTQIFAGPLDLDTFKKLLEYKFGNNYFTFDQGIKYFTKKTSPENSTFDNIFLTLFMASVINYVNEILGNVLLLPATNLSYDIVNADKKRYYLFGYDLRNDPNEAINLLDRLYPQRQTENVVSIFTEMNDRLNSVTVDKYKCKEITYIVPITGLNDGLLKSLKENGDNISTYTQDQIYNFGSLYSTQGRTKGMNLFGPY